MVNQLLLVSLSLMMISFVLSAIRFFKGPSAYDRVVAMDVLTIISISLIVYISHMYGRVILVDVALVYALLSFIGVIAISRYLEKDI